MSRLLAYVQLTRLNKPIGILLLWYPTAWALWMAKQAPPSLRIMVLFFIGTVLTRSAGCVMNDIADRNIDKHVKRTNERPLTANKVNLKEAFCIMGVLLAGALCILMQLPQQCFFWAVIAVLLSGIYPFAKRVISAPQLVLGIAFSMGIPMAYAALDAQFDWRFYALFLLNYLWIVAYDTMYAMVDREDDLKIGVYSTAIYFGRFDVIIIMALVGLMHMTWLLLAVLLHYSIAFYLFWLLSCGVLLYQYYLIRERQPACCFRAFLVSALYGVLMWLALGMM